jgi:hypothetical protein
MFAGFLSKTLLSFLCSGRWLGFCFCRKEEEEEEGSKSLMEL